MNVGSEVRTERRAVVALCDMNFWSDNMSPSSWTITEVSATGESYTKPDPLLNAIMEYLNTFTNSTVELFNLSAYVIAGAIVGYHSDTMITRIGVGKAIDCGRRTHFPISPPPLVRMRP